jgi:hypothetical protein
MSSTITLPGGATVSIPAHQAGGRPKYIPKVSYLPTRSGDTSQVWKSSGVFLDFLLPKNVGILNNVRFRFQVNNASGAQPVPPTCQWVQQIEIMVGTTIVETLFPNDLLTEVAGFMGTDETNAKNIELAMYTATQAYGHQAPAGSRYYYLPFNNALTCSRLYVSGVDDDITYRVYFPPNMFPSTFTMTNCVLEINEDVPVDQVEVQKLRDAHKRGIVYNTVVRQRQQTVVTKNDTASNMNIDLTGIVGKSAGLVVYADVAVVPGAGNLNDPTGNGSTVNGSGVTVPGTVPANQLLGWRLPIGTLEIDDQMGNKRTEQLQGLAQQSFVWWDHVGTEFANNVNYNTYLLPFATNFKNTVEEGANYGYLNFDGTDRLVLTAPFFWQSANPSPYGSSESWVVTITNYVYNQLVFSNNKLTTISKR